GDDVVFRDAERGQFVLRQVHAAELDVLADVAHDVDQLERDPERLGPLRLVGAVDGRAGDAHGPGDLAAVAGELVEVGIARPGQVLEAAVDEVVQGPGRNRIAGAGVFEGDPERVVAGRRVQSGVKLLEPLALVASGQVPV